MPLTPTIVQNCSWVIVSECVNLNQRHLMSLACVTLKTLGVILLINNVNELFVEQTQL